MKKHFLSTVLVLSGLMLLSSCLKDDPANNETIFYGYQQIPNINEYMPQSLLMAMGNENLYYGEEPPKIEGSFTTNNTLVTRVILTPESHWVLHNGSIDGYRYFKFFDQHFGIAKLNYLYYNSQGQGISSISEIERSRNDSTLYLVKEYIDQFTADSLMPVYFENTQYHTDVLNNVYIIGNDPYFTIYYYDIIYNHLFHPLKANIISGKIDKETVVEIDTVSGINDTIVRPVIKNFKWGIEIMTYFKGGQMLNLLLNPTAGQQTLGKPGDIVIIENPTVVGQGAYQE